MPLPKTHAFGRLKELPPEMVSEVDRRLLAGEPASSVARWLQADEKRFTDLQLASLKKNLQRYSAVDLRDRVMSGLTGTNKHLTIKTLAKRLNAQDELEKLCDIQKGRVDRLLMKEAELGKAGIVLKTTSDEIRLLKENLVELGKLQLETGVLKRVPKSVSGQVMDPLSGEVRHFNWTEEQDHLYRELEGMVVVPDEAPADA